MGYTKKAVHKPVEMLIEIKTSKSRDVRKGIFRNRFISTFKEI